jgi:FixJ family two-component response regulator
MDSVRAATSGRSANRAQKLPDLYPRKDYEREGRHECFGDNVETNCELSELVGMTKLIAIIDDDEAMQDSLRDLIEAAGLEARCFGSAEEFLESGLHRQAACLITDIRMPKMSGLELQARLKDEECDIPIIFITAYGDARMRIQAMREGAVEFLAKPLDHQLLLKTVRAAIDM